MNLKELTNLLKINSISKKSVNEFNEGDVYENLNSGEHKYGNINFTINSVEHTENTMLINCYLFYIDRLLEDNSNKLDIWTTGVNTLKQVLESSKSVADFFDYSQLTFTTFTEKFSDLCAGVYATVQIEVLDGGTCDEEYTADYDTITITENGEYFVNGFYKITINVSCEESYDLGFQDGYSKGDEEGYNRGYSEGYEIGDAEGYQEGYEEGVIEGREEGIDAGYMFGYKDGYYDGYNKLVPKINLTAKTSSHGSIAMNHFGTNATTTKPNLQYTKNGIDWIEWDGSPIDIDYPETVAFKGTNEAISHSDTDYSTFSFTGVEIEGNLAGLLDGGKCEDLELHADYTFCKLFFFYAYGLVDASKIYLPFTKLSKHCFRSMFAQANIVYPVTELPAKNLEEGCYFAMYSRCGELRKPSIMKATKLAEYCCRYMYQYCEKLEEAPDLLSLSLVKGCYDRMHYNAHSLNYIMALYTSTPSSAFLNGTTYDYLYGVASSGVFVKNINATWTGTGSWAVPSGWRIIYYDDSDGKYWTSKSKTQECDKHGNII